MPNHKEWVRISTGDSLRAVARAIGVNQGNFSRQTEQGLSADRVIAIAHAYNLNAVDALLDTGHFLPSDDPRSELGSIEHVIQILEEIKAGKAVTQTERWEISEHSPYN